MLNCQAYPAVSCSEPAYTRLIGLFYVLIGAVVVAVPLALFVFLWYSHRAGLIATERMRVARAQSDSAHAVSRQRMDKYLSRYGVLWEAYVPERCTSHIDSN